MDTPSPLTDEELAEIEELARAATPGPWHVRQLDDDFAMSLVAISTVPDTGADERRPDFDHRQIAAAILVQQPRHIDVADERWDENANFIANARQDFPHLIAEIRRLRHLLEAKDQSPRKAEAHPRSTGIDNSRGTWRTHPLLSSSNWSDALHREPASACSLISSLHRTSMNKGTEEPPGNSYPPMAYPPGPGR
ncbi:hypothetical protein [Streptomyces sp. HUCO-GS316]|uniref:hypothetical protein n=1 Tax=Streptomyces sp. HUCO-GS316 TaxID=2692198 RepID=UPI001F1ACA06|nr:hypothetical protein [Streptomyces sp. HUCO-GS316]